MPTTCLRPALLAACLLLCNTVRAQDTPDARADVEAELAGRPAAEVLAFVNRLADDWPAHNGAVEVAHQRFTAQAAEATKARQRVDDLKPPAGPPPLVLRAADVEAAVADARTRADFFATRAKYLGGLADALAALAAAGADFDRAAITADVHLIKTRVAAALATKAGAGKLPDAATAKQLDAATKHLKALVAAVRPVLDQAKRDRASLPVELVLTNAMAEAATAKLAALTASQSEALTAFAFAEQARGMAPAQLADEFTRLRSTLAEKLGAIDGDERDYAKARATATDARAAFDAVKDPLALLGRDIAAPADVPAPAELEAAARDVAAEGQRFASHMRAMTDRAEKAQALVAALDELEKEAVAYLTTLDDARRLASQTAALAAEIGARVGRGDLEAAKAPAGVTDVTSPAERAKLDTAAADVRAALERLRAERTALRTPDAASENIKALTAVLLAEVNERAELLAELKRLAGEYGTARKDRPDAEQKRLAQKAADRMARDAGPWDWALAFDRSRPAANASELLAAYYRDLIAHDERADNLKRQKDTLESLVELTKREAADIAKLRTLLEKRVATSEGTHDWDDWLAGRLAPTGLPAEAGAYRDEAARLTAVAATGAKRAEALTGEIGRARDDLQAARLRGLGATGIKIGVILLAALLIPRVVMFVLRRAIRGGTDEAGNPSPVLAALRGVLKAGVWIAAVALILSTLGYDVTALVVALAIGVLAVALAARPMIADILGSVAVFADRRFKVGDVVRLGADEPARVVGLTWRSTALKNASGLVVSVPNRKVTEEAVENLTRGDETYDALAVRVSTDNDAGKVITVIRAAVAQCKNVSADNGVTVVRFNQKGAVKVVDYRFWWFLKDYEARNKTRDEVFARIALGLANEDMTGIEVSLG